MGQLLAGWEAKIVTTDPSESVGPEVLATYNEPGELYLRGPSVALRYEGNEKA